MSKLFGIPLEQQEHVPHFLYEGLKYISDNPAEGVFRQPGDQMLMNKVKSKLDKGDYLTMIEFGNVHNIASVIKLYFRELPNSFFSKTFERKCRNVFSGLSMREQREIEQQKKLDKYRKKIKNAIGLNQARRMKSITGKEIDVKKFLEERNKVEEEEKKEKEFEEDVEKNKLSEYEKIEQIRLSLIQEQIEEKKVITDPQIIKLKDLVLDSFSNPIRKQALNLLLRCLHVISSREDTTKMTKEAITICILPSLTKSSDTSELSKALGIMIEEYPFFFPEESVIYDKFNEKSELLKKVDTQKKKIEELEKQLDYLKSIDIHTGEGWLRKKGVSKKAGWHWRYFRCDNKIREFSYYHSHKESKSIKTIQLDKKFQVYRYEDPEKCFAFLITTEARIWYFLASSEPERVLWINYWKEYCKKEEHPEGTWKGFCTMKVKSRTEFRFARVNASKRTISVFHNQYSQEIFSVFLDECEIFIEGLDVKFTETLKGGKKKVYQIRLLNKEQLIEVKRLLE